MKTSLKNTSFSTNRQLDCKGKRLDLNSPAVMGILNITPDSFFDGGCYQKETDMLLRTEVMVQEGADIIDIGAMSTRPGAMEVPENEERQRILRAILSIRKAFPEIIISIDTYHATLAEESLSAGADIINDISGGQFDNKMFEVISRLGAPYVMMHIQGTPQNMQKSPSYIDVVQDIKAYFLDRINKLSEMGFSNIILDPGFGFGKTVKHNYQLLNRFEEFADMGFAVLAGLSRKSMINKILKIKPGEALNGTTVVNTIALLKGANILRVHDVKEAKEAIRIVKQLYE